MMWGRSSVGRAPRCNIGEVKSSMAYIYILKTSNNKYYVGSTNKLDRRFLEHSIGKTKSLKYIRPLKIVFKQRFQNIILAKKIEVKLKRFKSRKIIKQIIKDGYIKTGP